MLYFFPLFFNSILIQFAFKGMEKCTHHGWKGSHSSLPGTWPHMEILVENGGFHRDRCVLCDGKGPQRILPGALLHQISEWNEHAVLQVLDQ